ncbi:alpha/beta hydrolase [Neolewinella persica]|uniref:alpha/beta hydrolase n=1 Tax=Neolewinella persica TaxID=70998 RepID=UPI00037D28BF|nr:alpha/beta hydrolase-fold protein [Neolewinella persica]
MQLPKGYVTDRKYPVIYTLDRQSLFPIVADYVKHLGNETDEDGYDLGTNSIPAAIVVGVHHANRGEETEPNFEGIGYLPGPQKLYDFLTRELIPYVDSTYSTSGYDVIIGHSNTAQFVTNSLLMEKVVFDGVIALSLVEGSDGFNERLENRLKVMGERSYFLGYGFKDNEFNDLAKELSGKLDNEGVLISGYNANHGDLPVVSLLDGLKFTFRDYRNFECLISASKFVDFSVAQYVDDYGQRMKSHYGILTDINEDDYGYLIVESVNNRNVNLFNELIKYDEQKNDFEYQEIILFHYRKELGDLDGAKSLAYRMLSSDEKMMGRFLLGQLDAFVDFFAKDLAVPLEAIEFLEKIARKYPDSRLTTSYFIANTSRAYNVELEKGKMSLKYCVEHYEGNRFFDEKDLGELE